MDELKEFFRDILSPSTIWNSLASVLAVSCVAVPYLLSSIWDISDFSNITTVPPLRGTPLGSVYELLNLLAIPSDWVPAVHEYLTADDARRTVLLAIFYFMGIMCCLVPYRINPLPSTAASTLWICAAAIFQIEGSFPWDLALLFLMKCVWEFIKAEKNHRFTKFMEPIGHVVVSFAFIPAIFILVPLGLAVMSKDHDPINVS